VGILAVIAVFRVLAASDSAGFAVPGLSSYEYALTQARVLLLSVSLFILPVGLTVDHDFPVSRSLLDHGAGVAILIWVAVLAAAIVWRRKYPIACYGALLFLILLAPTSSFIPIKDVIAERRMYLPMLGLLLITLDAVSRLRMSPPALASVFGFILIALGIGTYERSKAWGDSEVLWKGAIAAAPKKARPYANLASLYLVRRQCAQGLEVIDKAAAALGRVDDGYLLATWGLTLECMGNRSGAIDKMRLAIAEQPSSQSYTALARLYLDSGMLSEAEQALAEAERLDSRWELTYVYRALMLIRRNDHAAATAQLQHALAINPSNALAQQLLGQVITRARSME
jgi:tetratricopeptide (TPR) repeat protein